MISLSDPILLVTLWIGCVIQYASIVHAECSGRTKIKVDPYLHKAWYTIGIHATLDLESALDETHQVFADYLTATAGARFDPPIQFKVDPKDYDGIFTSTMNQEIDFVYSNSGVYACIGNQFGATALSTIVRQVMIRGQILDLDVYGGVMAVRQDNDQINTILDLKDKVIGAASILDLMGGQMQFYEMEKAGMSYVNDPKQVIFAKNQADVVRGVASGRFDVGFIRTDQIELTTDANGTLLDPNLFKILDPKMDIMDSGDIFPFLHTTNIYPEWPLAALSHVAGDVQLAVQNALRDFGAHAAIGQALQECIDSGNETQFCNVMNFQDIIPNPPCDATEDLALLAAQGSNKSHIHSFRTASSYFALTEVEQEAGFMLRDESTGGWHCLRPSSLFEGITCPEGHFKRNLHEFHNGCSQVGLSCTDNEENDCFCKPCVKAHEVDVYHLADGEQDPHLEDYYGDTLPGCEKMSICGTIEQGKSITLRIFDNLFREGAVVNVTIHAGDNPINVPVQHLPGTHAYEFTVTDDEAQVQVIEILFDGTPILSSPIRVMVVNADCDAQYGANSHRIPDTEGKCVCAGHTYAIGESCIDSTYFFLVIFSAVMLVMGILVVLYLGYKKKQSDSVWHINVDELHFNEPPDVIGQGGFGVVILGEYRGTKVAVKRVLPPSKASKSPGSSITSDDNEEVQEYEKGKEATTTTTDSSSSKQHPKLGNPSTMTSRKIKFCDDSTDVPGGDIESQTPTKVTKTGSNSCSGSLDNWERLLDNRHSNNDVLRLLESATLSDHGSGSLTGKGSVSQSGVWQRYLPLCLRFDPHSRRVSEFVIEMRMLSRLRHPCITTVMGAVVSSSLDPMLVMEYMEYGSLYDLLHNETLILGGEIILQMIRDIVQGVQFLHASKPPILHGDLKARNVLVDSRFRAKVADFGFSQCSSGSTGGGRHHSTSPTALLKGTPFYMAPEYLRHRTEYTTACDIYSLAMIIYELYARSGPFEGEDPRKLLPKICHPRLNKRPAIPKACPPKMVDIMKRCWGTNPSFRPTAKDMDHLLMELNARDAEPLVVVGLGGGLAATLAPLVREQQQQHQNGPTSMYDVFPKHIADALVAGKKVEAESHDIVTVVFSDIVGFTTISEQVSPLKIAQMLDRLYHALDTLCRKHHIFKVETVGDAYMGVTNLDGTENDSHVKQVAEYCIEAVQAASELLIDAEDPSRGYVQIRMGFHSGPVVSNVIGSLNPRYGLFGDTVNTASRMESNSVPGRIHCSSVSAELLQSQAPMVPLKLRGMIRIKGKGKMKTYWIGNDGNPLAVPPSRVSMATTKPSVKSKRPSKILLPLGNHGIIDTISERSSEYDDLPVNPHPEDDSNPDDHDQDHEDEDVQTADGRDPDDNNNDAATAYPPDNKYHAPYSPDELGLSHRTQATVICDSLSEIGDEDELATATSFHDDDGHPHTPVPLVRPKLRMKKKMIHCQMNGELQHIMDCNLIHLPVNLESSTCSTGTNSDDDNNHNNNNKDDGYATLECQ